MIGNKVALKLPSPDLQNSALISATNDAVSNQLAVLPEQAQAMALGDHPLTRSLIRSLIRSLSYSLFYLLIHSFNLEFSETVGTGAISKSGAITMGDDGSWIKLAEEKIIKDHSLDHHSLMWELGTASLCLRQQLLLITTHSLTHSLTHSGTKVIEKSTIKNGINVTEEERLLRSMEEWFIKGT